MSRSARARNAAYKRAYEEANASAIKHARSMCEDEFEPLWRPICALAAYAERGRNRLERADLQAAAKKAAFAWLAAKLRLPALSSFDQLDLDQLRDAWRFIFNATLLDVQRWAEAEEAGACAESGTGPIQGRP